MEKNFSMKNLYMFLPLHAIRHFFYADYYVGIIHSASADLIWWNMVSMEICQGTWIWSRTCYQYIVYSWICEIEGRNNCRYLPITVVLTLGIYPCLECSYLLSEIAMVTFRIYFAKFFFTSISPTSWTATIVFCKTTEQLPELDSCMLRWLCLFWKGLPYIIITSSY